MFSHAEGSLVIIDGRRDFWRGVEVPGVEQIVLHADSDETHIRLRVSGNADDVYEDMRACGIRVKERRDG